MKTVEERVAELKDRHARGYNCAQVVLCSYADVLSIDEETLFQISEGFGAGMGGMMETCGAVTAMFMALGLKNSSGRHAILSHRPCVWCGSWQQNSRIKMVRSYVGN